MRDTPCWHWATALRLFTGFVALAGLGVGLYLTRRYGVFDWKGFLANLWAGVILVALVGFVVWLFQTMLQDRWAASAEQARTRAWRGWQAQLELHALRSAIRQRTTGLEPGATGGHEPPWTTDWPPSAVVHVIYTHALDRGYDVLKRWEKDLEDLGEQRFVSNMLSYIRTYQQGQEVYARLGNGPAQASSEYQSALDRLRGLYNAICNSLREP